MPDTFSEVADWRRQIHAQPELGYEEVKTAAFVADKLKGFGIETHTGFATTGVVGVIEGKRGPGRTIALRADMDALPMTEMNRFAYASTHAGRMHACGHDGHTAMLLGAARDLAAQRIGEIAKGVGSGLGVEIDYDYRRCFPATINSEAESDAAARAAASVVGAENVRRNEPPSMTAEDFAFMLEARPGCYIWLGQGSAEHPRMLHSPTYDFNDTVIPTGIAWWKAMVADRLGQA